MTFPDQTFILCSEKDKNGTIRMSSFSRIFGYHQCYVSSEIGASGSDWSGMSRCRLIWTGAG